VLHRTFKHTSAHRLIICVKDIRAMVSVQRGGRRGRMPAGGARGAAQGAQQSSREHCRRQTACCSLLITISHGYDEKIR